MHPQFAQRFHNGPTAATPRQFLRQNFHRAVHPDGKHFFNIRNIRINRAVFHIRAKAANRSFDRLPIFGVAAHKAWQRQQLYRAFDGQCFGRPALGQTGTRRFGGGFGRFALLNIRAKAARPQAYFHAVRIKPQNPAIDRPALIPRNRPGVPAVRIIAAANKRPPRPRCFQMQPPGATGLANARITAIGTQGIQMRT